MNRSISGRIFEIGSDGDDVTVGDISIFHCYRKELRSRLDHLQKLNVIVDDEVTIKEEEFFQIPLRPASSSHTSVGALCVAQVCRAYITLAYKHYLVTHEYALGDAQLQQVQKLAQCRLGHYVEPPCGDPDTIAVPLSARDRLYVQRLYELLSFELLRCHALSLVQQAKFSFGVKRLSLAIDTVPSIDSHFSSGLADALLLSYECYKALLTTTPVANNASGSAAKENQLQEKALQSAKLAVNVAHERMQLAVSRDSNEEYFLKYSDVFLGESVVLDCCTSLVLSYVALGEALELGSSSNIEDNGDSSNHYDWYVRALQTAEKHHLDEMLLVELQRLVNAKKQQTVAKSAIAAPTQQLQPVQQRSVLLLDEDDDDDENNDFDRVFFSRPNNQNSNSNNRRSNSPERKTTNSASPTSNILNRPRSALPRLSDINSSGNYNYYSDAGAYSSSAHYPSSSNHPENGYIANNIQPAVLEADIHRPRSALSKLGESYNNYTPHSQSQQQPVARYANNGNSGNMQFAENNFSGNPLTATFPPPVSPYPLSSSPYPGYFPYPSGKNRDQSYELYGVPSYQTLPTVNSDYPLNTYIHYDPTDQLPRSQEQENPPSRERDGVASGIQLEDYVQSTQSSQSSSQRQQGTSLRPSSSRAIILLPTDFSVTSEKEKKKSQRPESGKRRIHKASEPKKMDKEEQEATGHQTSPSRSKKSLLRPSSAASVLPSSSTSNRKALAHSSTAASLLPPMASAKTLKNKTLLSRTLSSVPSSSNGGKQKTAHNQNVQQAVYNLSEEQIQKQEQKLEELYLPLFKGMAVEARYNKPIVGEKKALWLAGRIVKADFRHARYSVEFAHGPIEKDIPADDIRINSMQSRQQMQQRFQHQQQTEFQHSTEGAMQIHPHGSKARMSGQEIRSKATSNMYTHMLRILREASERKDVRSQEKFTRQNEGIVPLQALVRGFLYRRKFEREDRQYLETRQALREQQKQQQKLWEEQQHEWQLIQKQQQEQRDQETREKEMEATGAAKEAEEVKKLSHQASVESVSKDERLEMHDQESPELFPPHQIAMVNMLQQQNELLSQQLEELRRDLKRSLALLHHQHLVVQNNAQNNNNNGTNGFVGNGQSITPGTSFAQTLPIFPSPVSAEATAEQEEKLQRMMHAIEDRFMLTLQQHQMQFIMQQEQLQLALYNAVQSQPQVLPIAPIDDKEAVLKNVQTDMAHLKDAMQQTLEYIQQSMNQAQAQFQSPPSTENNVQPHIEDAAVIKNASFLEDRRNHIHSKADDESLYAYFDRSNFSFTHQPNGMKAQPHQQHPPLNVAHIDDDDFVVGLGEGGLISAPLSSGGSLFQYQFQFQEEEDVHASQVQTNTEMNRSVHVACNVGNLNEGNNGNVIIDTSEIHASEIPAPMQTEDSQPIMYLSLSQFDIAPYQVSAPVSQQEDGSQHQAWSPLTQPQNPNSWLLQDANEYVSPALRMPPSPLHSAAASASASIVSAGGAAAAAAAVAATTTTTTASPGAGEIQPTPSASQVSFMAGESHRDSASQPDVLQLPSTNSTSSRQPPLAVPQFALENDADDVYLHMSDEGFGTSSQLSPTTPAGTTLPLDLVQKEQEMIIHESSHQSQSVVSDFHNILLQEESSSSTILDAPAIHTTADTDAEAEAVVDADIDVPEAEAVVDADIDVPEAVQQCAASIVQNLLQHAVGANYTGDQRSSDCTHKSTVTTSIFVPPQPVVEENSSYVELDAAEHSYDAAQQPPHREGFTPLEHHRAPLASSSPLLASAVAPAAQLAEDTDDDVPTGPHETGATNEATSGAADSNSVSLRLVLDLDRPAIPEEDADEEGERHCTAAGQVVDEEDGQEKDREVLESTQAAAAAAAATVAVAVAAVAPAIEQVENDVVEAMEEEDITEFLVLPETLPLLDVSELWNRALKAARQGANTNSNNNTNSNSNSNSKSASASSTSKLLKAVSSLPPLLAIGFSLSACTAANEESAARYHINQAKLLMQVMDKALDAKESVHLPRGIVKQLYLLHVQQGCSLPFQLDQLPSKRKRTAEHEDGDGDDHDKGKRTLAQLLAQIPKICVRYTLPAVEVESPDLPPLSASAKAAAHSAKQHPTELVRSPGSVSGGSSGNLMQRTNSQLMAIVEEDAASKDDGDGDGDDDAAAAKLSIQHPNAVSTASSTEPSTPVCVSSLLKKKEGAASGSSTDGREISHDQEISAYQLKKLFKRALAGLAQDKDVQWTPLWHHISSSSPSSSAKQPGAASFTNASAMTPPVATTSALDVGLWCRATAVRFDRIVAVVVAFIWTLFLQQAQLLRSQAALTVSLTQLLVLLHEEQEPHDMHASDIAGQHRVLSPKEHEQLVIQAQEHLATQLLQARHLQWQWQHRLSRCRALLRRELRRFDFDKKRLLDYASFDHNAPLTSSSSSAAAVASHSIPSASSSASSVSFPVVTSNKLGARHSNSSYLSRKREEETSVSNDENFQVVESETLSDDDDDDDDDSDSDREQRRDRDEEDGDSIDHPRAPKQRRKTMSMSFTSAQLRQYTTVRSVTSSSAQAQQLRASSSSSPSSASSYHPQQQSLAETPLAETADMALFSGLQTLACTSMYDAFAAATLQLTGDKSVFNAAGVEISLRQSRSPYASPAVTTTRRRTRHDNGGGGVGAECGEGIEAVEEANEAKEAKGEEEDDDDDDDDSADEDDATLDAYHCHYVREHILSLWAPPPPPLPPRGSSSVSKQAAASAAAAAAAGAVSTTISWVDKVSALLLGFVHSLHVTNMLLAAPQLAQKVAFAAQCALESSLEVLFAERAAGSQEAKSIWPAVWFHQDVLVQMVGKKMAGTMQRKIVDFLQTYRHYDEEDDDDDDDDDEVEEGGEIERDSARRVKNRHRLQRKGATEGTDEEEDEEGGQGKKNLDKDVTKREKTIHEEEDDDRFMLHFLHLWDSNNNNNNRTNNNSSNNNRSSNNNSTSKSDGATAPVEDESALSALLRAIPAAHHNHLNHSTKANRQHQTNDTDSSNLDGAQGIAQQPQSDRSKTAQRQTRYGAQDAKDVASFRDFVLGQRFILMSSQSSKGLRQSLTQQVAASIKLKAPSPTKVGGHRSPPFP